MFCFYATNRRIPILMKMRSCALLGFLFLTLHPSSECLQTLVRPDAGVTVTVSTALPPGQCSVCTVGGVNATQTTCHASLTLAAEEEVKLLLNCSEPIDQSYSVIIARTIECTKDACSPTMVHTQPSLLTELRRTFTWELKAPEKTLVSLDILGVGLTETSQPCLDGLQFTVVVSETSSKTRTQYCQDGSVTRLNLPDQAVVSLQAEAKTEVQSLLFQASAGPLKGRTMVVSVDSSTAVILSRDPQEPECEVCSVDGSAPNCSPTGKTLTDVLKLSLEFSCLRPQDVYSVKMKKKIECTKSLCAPAAGEVDLDLFNDFRRSLMWDISLPERTVLSLDFPAGLTESLGAGNCPEGYQYSVSTTKSDGRVKTSRYCRGGTVSHLDLLGATVVTVEVPKQGDLGSAAFSVTAAPRGGRMMDVTTDPNTIINIRNETADPDCSVCQNKASAQTCHPIGFALVNANNTSIEFTCPQPQHVYTVEINRQIDCTETSCPGDIVQAESSLFLDFNRTFTWDLKVVSTRFFQLDFPEPGMRQIPNEDTCPDEHTYSVVTYQRTGPETVGTFCKGGIVSAILGRYKGRVSVQVSADRKLEPVDVKLSVGPEATMVAVVKVDLPRGVSDTGFITANYPDGFPDNQQMQWDFTVPGMHNYTVEFRNHSAPGCLDGEVEVEYQREGKKATKLSLTDPQPKHEQGNFNMVLKNCRTNRTLKGLSLSYKVSVMRSGHPVLCTLDLTKHPGVSLQIERVGSDPYCEMSVDSKAVEKIKVAAGSKASLSFLDCPDEDLRLTARKVIVCQNVSSCPAVPLVVPKLDSCLPMPLHSFTWDVGVPQDGTVDLTSPTGSFGQSISGQEGNQSVSLHVAESDGFSVGDFCYNGDIERVRVHANISVTATASDFTAIKESFLNVSFSQEIPETIIYKISPKTSSPSMLATPNWPRGMRSSSTVSWIVALPSQYQAQLQFVNISQPKCTDRHTSIKVKMLGQEEEILSRREDEQHEDMLLVPQSFYLNMSNCVPQEGHFGAVVKIILEKKTNLLAIILGIVGALLLLLTVLAVVCIVMKKKKKDKMNEETSIYIGKGNIFRPGDRHFSKGRSDNESHVYDSIDETMVYGHLLRDSSYADSMPDHFNGMQVDSYQTFTGPLDVKLPVIKEPDQEPEMDQYKAFLDPSENFLPARPRTPIDRQDSLGFQDSRMVDNELYTFKSTGTFNTIRLSAADMEPEPPLMEESL